MCGNAIRLTTFTGGFWFTSHAGPLLYAVAGAGLLVAVLALTATFARRKVQRDAAYDTLALLLDVLRPPGRKRRLRSSRRSPEPDH